jgi:hypothetical protein
MVLTINNETYLGIGNREDLLEIVQAHEHLNAEIWLKLNGDPEGELPHLCLLKKGQLCCVQYLINRIGIPRFYSYDPEPIGGLKKVSFELADGDSYETYSSNCVSLENGYAVMIHFLETYGGKSTWIDWIKD